MGRGGSCWAFHYKDGAEFLLFLKRHDPNEEDSVEWGEVTPYWASMAPTNEQLHSPDGAWLRWVKDYLKRDGAELKKQSGGDFSMPEHVDKPSVVKAAGNKPKIIEEYVGRVNTGTEAVSVARMRSPGGWEEPGQTPEFDEYTVVLRGMLRVKTRGGSVDVREGQAVITRRGEWVQYSTPEQEGAEYVAVCLPAFSMETVHRDE
jgi:mannose-6-phosphate isomerase-like protein (cupin superfamily)